jgi:hypothetical protein
VFATSHGQAYSDVMINAFRSRFPQTTADYELALSMIAYGDRHPSNERTRTIAGKVIYLNANELIQLGDAPSDELRAPRRHVKGFWLNINQEDQTVKLAHTTRRSFADRFHIFTADISTDNPELSYEWQSMNVDFQAVALPGKLSHEELVRDDAAMKQLVDSAFSLICYTQTQRVASGQQPGAPQQ